MGRNRKQGPRSIARSGTSARRPGWRYLMLLMIDNYDSFTYNLVQYFGELGEDVRTVRNDQISLADIEALQPQRLVLSPGPCSPAEAGICIEAIRHFAGKLPILGVCLAHQAIGAALGGKVVRAQRQMHGKASAITTDQRGRPCRLAQRRSPGGPDTLPG